MTRRSPETFVVGDAVFMIPGDPPWWRRTRLGRAYTNWRSRRALRGWTELGYIDATGDRSEAP